ncbi:telomere repeats-binding bouquet formation protein 2 isoform X2 [Heliangelus exortis]|uniref:telomere repeats-binding bouquet formation protein 2 isoform X2 n=1 Tax=Heliangelus exortis TaxID=472823 RepID=UPI003A93E352
MASHTEPGRGRSALATAPVPLGTAPRLSARHPQRPHPPLSALPPLPLELLPPLTDPPLTTPHRPSRILPSSSRSRFSPAMFRGHRAWFSQSVSPAPRALWVAGGGTLAHWQDADFLFSSDSAHPDTRRIHESLDYLEGRATVFHSRYLSAWAGSSTGVKSSVVLGHFILPPACLQEEIRRKIGCFIWEQRDDSLAEQPNENLGDDLEVAREGCGEGAGEEVLDLTKSKEASVSRAPALGGFPYRALQEYPMNNMVTGYTSARDMKKYAGELHDFTPGTSGYAAYWIQKEINISSDTKAKMKRKL